MRFQEFKEKEVINICDCERLGYICDIEFNAITGQILRLIIPGPCKILGILGCDSEYVIDYCCIRQIGEDIILVEVDKNKVLRKC